MRHFVFAGALLALCAVPAQADDAACVERFKQLLVDGNPGKGPAKAHITQSFGTMNTENNFYSLGAGSADGMMEPVKGMGDQQVLFRKGKMFVSTDKGKSWTFVREMDKGASPESVKEKLKADADTATDVSCGTEALDGVDHETVEGNYVASTAQGRDDYGQVLGEPGDRLDAQGGYHRHDGWHAERDHADDRADA
jgi:hypothetical protein